MKSFKILALILLSFFVSSCSIKDKLFIQDNAKSAEIIAPKVLVEIPWKSWENGKDLKGLAFANRFVSQADEMQDLGQFAEAVRYYYLALDPALTAEHEEQIRIRLSSAELLDGRAQSALDNLSNFYKSKNLNVQAVPAQSALLFAFIYGRLGNVSQSVAWFVQSALDPQYLSKSRDGLEKLLAAMNDAEVLAAEPEWQSTVWVAELFSAEKNHRISNPLTIALADNQPFWSRNNTVAGVTSEAPAGKYKISVILPLTGKYQNFGKSLEQGIRLALSDLKSSDASVEFYDGGGGSIKSKAVCEEHVSGASDIVIGSLLSEDSQAISECVLAKKATAISFAKRSDFKTGAGIYRLGMTVEDQMASLFGAASNNLKVSKFALAYPAENSAYAYVEAFKKLLSAQQLSPIFEYTYYKNPLPDFSELESEIKTYKPEALLVIDNIDMLVRLLSALSESSRKNVHILGQAEWSDPDKLKQSQAILSGIKFVTPFLIEESPLVTNFVTSYTTQFQQVPDWLAAQGFDAATIVAAAVKRALSENVSFRNVLNNIKEYEGLTGRITVSGSGELNRRLKVVEYKEEGIFEVAQNHTPIYVYRGNEKIAEPESSPQR